MNDDIIKEIYDNTDVLMKTLFDKYSNGKDIYQNIIYKTLKNNITMNIVFSELKIVTITINAILPIDIDYKNFVTFVNERSEFIPKIKLDKNVLDKEPKLVNLELIFIFLFV